MILISVIVPIYKVEAYLSTCIESILAQTYQYLEIFLVDDGSPDRCGAICDDYAQRDSRIRVIHKANGGLSDARNAALDVAQGEWVIFVDSDDYISHTHIEQLYQLARQQKADISIHLPHPFLEGEQARPSNNTSYSLTLSPLEAIEQMFYQRHFDTSAWAKLYKRSLFDNIRYPKGLLYEDLPTTYRLMLRAIRVAFQPIKSYYYLQRSTSIENAPFSEKKYSSCLTILDLMERDNHLFVGIERSLQCRLLSFVFHILLEIPSSHPGRSVLENKIRQLRWMVMTDSRARPKARVAAAFSYLSFGIIRHIFQKIKSRS